MEVGRGVVFGVGMNHFLCDGGDIGIHTAHTPIRYQAIGQYDNTGIEGKSDLHLGA
jgi:hypothetical protein